MGYMIYVQKYYASVSRSGHRLGRATSRGMGKPAMEHIPASSVEHDETYESESLTVLQAARRAGVTQGAIIRWIRNGYLPATSSSNGWQIPVRKLAEAQAAADESRGTGPVPRQAGPRLLPAPADLRRSLATQAQEQPARLDVIGEALVSPLVELIRDQGDVVHDQAEVIGWLQAERARLAAQVAELQSQEPAPVSQPAPALAAETAPPADGDVDEVVSWLWNDTDRSLDGQEWASQPAEETAEPEPSQPTERLMNQSRMPEYGSVAAQMEPDAAKPQDLAGERHDFVWATNTVNDDSASSAVTFRTGPAPVLQPIVPRHGEDGSVGSETLIQAGSDVELQQMIDKTEAKIFNLWRAEAEKEFHDSNDRLDNAEDSVGTGGTAFWQRVWPLNRRSS